MGKLIFEQINESSNSGITTNLDRFDNGNNTTSDIYSSIVIFVIDYLRV